jgi:DNA-directed RNA polymerase subunit RPC12/RpoP
MNKLRWTLAACLVVALIVPLAVSAQGEGESLQLGLTRNFGYGGLGRIQGNFSLKIIDPPAGLNLVEFFFDGELISSVEKEPFLYKFHTSQFTDGEHRISAIGYLEDGTQLGSNQISKEFLSSGQAWGETQQLIGPILIGTAVLTVLGIGVPLLFNREKDFVLGSYGPAGGTVCSRCDLPFSRSLLAPNLLAGKLVRCPHCGKIGIMARASQARLQEAEARFAGKDQPGPAAAGNDDLSKLIEDSRFEE